MGSGAKDCPSQAWGDCISNTTSSIYNLSRRSCYGPQSCSVPIKPRHDWASARVDGHGSVLERSRGLQQGKISTCSDPCQGGPRLTVPKFHTSIYEGCSIHEVPTSTACAYCHTRRPDIAPRWCHPTSLTKAPSSYPWLYDVSRKARARLG